MHYGGSDPFADAGIVLENSPDTVVSGNFVYLQHSYPNGIEYRFSATRGVLIAGNISNKAIVSRDGGAAELVGNSQGSLMRRFWDSALMLAKRVFEAWQ
ncbi:conserved hypothetical protein [gamma proteobacterium NOR5-3]|nr:conserved hypothetical protein [gamma proteobacterium NOR5-3]